MPYRTAIAVSPTNENLIVFGTNDVWSNALGAFQKISPYIAYNQFHADVLSLTFEPGIWFKDASMADWKKYCDFPNVRVMEIKINYCMGKIRAATFGRSVWEGNLAFATSDLGSAELVISSTSVLPWNASRALDKNLRIKKGATLTIEGSSPSNRINIGMPANGKIIVEDGAKLVVTNANLTNACGQTWQGIEVWGNRNKRQTAPDQGTVVLTDATLEHANNAIATWKVGDINTTGAIIQATRASFLNNRRSTEFLDYENTTTTGAITDNASFYNECTFSINDQFRFSAGFKQHVTMWKARGVKLIGCKFEYVKSGTPPPFHVEECSGIRTIDATPRVSAKCANSNTFPCSAYIRSSFKGFNKGIYATATLGGYTLDVTRADFENNVVGIESDALTAPSVRACTFKVGKVGAIASVPTFHEGLILRSETGFVVDENIFEPNFSTQTPGTIGIRTRNSGGQANAIYRNTFRKSAASNPNNFYGNLANQDNRSTSNPVIGLQYLCNTNQNNVLNGFDFAVADGNGVARNQGALGGAAMNSFSKGVATPGSDFTNSAPFINYYASTAAGTVQYPDNVQTTASVLRYVSAAAGCPNQFDNPPSAGALVGQMATNKEQKEAAAALLKSKIDGGDTEGWLKRIGAFEPEILEKIRVLSPFVSSDLLMALVRNHGFWGLSNIVALLKENPGGESELLWEEMGRAGMEIGDMEVLRLELSKQKTARTEMQEVLNFWENECQSTATLVLHLLLTDSTLTDLGQIRAWAAHRPGLSTEMLITDLLLAEGKYGEASAYMGAIPLKLELSEKEMREFNYFSEVKNLQLSWLDGRKTPQTLDENELLLLQKIATESEGLAGDQARGFLNFFHEGGYFVPPVLPGEPMQERSEIEQETEAPSRPAVSARPNPSAGLVYFDCVLPENVHQGFITIFDIKGTPVKRMAVRHGETPQWDTAAYPAGEYFYAFDAGGKRLAKGLKIIVNKH